MYDSNLIKISSERKIINFHEEIKYFLYYSKYIDIANIQNNLDY